MELMVQAAAYVRRIQQKCKLSRDNLLGLDDIIIDITQRRVGGELQKDTTLRSAGHSFGHKAIEAAGGVPAHELAIFIVVQHMRV